MTTQVIQEQTSTNFFSSFIQFWDDVKTVAGPYWYPTQPGGRPFADVVASWLSLISLLLIIAVLVAGNAFNSFIGRYLVDSLIEYKDYSEFTKNLILNVIGLLVVTLLVGLSKYVRKQIALDWYKWLNDQVIDKYLKDRTYYKINFRSDVDNPDQRIAQELEPITSNALSFSATLVENILEMITFLAIIWLISAQIAIIILVYSVIGNIVAAYLNQELIKIKQLEIEYRGDYGYCLTHVRDQAESIAFFQGEKQELNIIQRRFVRLLAAIEERIGWERSKETFSKGYQSVIQVFPFLILAPLYVNNQIDFGQLGQASVACNMFATALGDIISEFSVSGNFSSYVQRLSEFSDALDEVAKQPQNVNTITIIEEDNFAFEDFTLETPDYEKVIVKDLSLVVQPGEGLLIVGQSGRGKSSLLRGIAGLWNSGSGRLLRPPLEQVLFLPQRPYILLGTLREQLLYPNRNAVINDAELEAILREVNLENLLSRIDNFDLEAPWESILSLGEQQRVAFARVLIIRPRFTILDEATSALDLQNERNLYQHLQRIKTTFISVGHRESLLMYHQWVLELSGDTTWQFMTIEDYISRRIIN